MENKNLNITLPPWKIDIWGYNDKLLTVSDQHDNEICKFYDEFNLFKNAENNAKLIKHAPELYDLLIRKLEFMKYIMDNHINTVYKQQWVDFINDVNKVLDEIK